MIYDYEGG